MTKVALTGASGFIGRSLLSQLIDKGLKINILDADNSTYPKEVNVFKGNLLTGEGINEFIEDSEILIHLAGQVLSSETSMEQGNVHTTETLIDSLSGTNIRKIIFSSSVAVYGNSAEKIFKETDNCNPDTEYGRSKFRAEKIIQNWSEKNHGTYTMFRFFSIYGPENKKGVIYNFCNDFIKNGSVTIFGDGHQRRDLIYITDVTDLIKLSVFTDLNGIYNVGSGEYFSILDLVAILEKISGKKCNLDFKNVEDEKVGEVFYSVDKLKEELNWQTKINIEEGINNVYQFLLKNEQ